MYCVVGWCWERVKKRIVLLAGSNSGSPSKNETTLPLDHWLAFV